MKRKFVQIAAFGLAAALFGIGSVTKAAAADEPPGLDESVIRVGLAYNGSGSSVMDGANLINAVGTGYRFGYYTSDKQFIELASVSEKAISMVKTTNVGYTANPATAYCNYVESLADTANVAVGCYHLQLPETYDSYEEAMSAASSYSGGFAAYIGGTFYARIGNYLNRSAAEAAQAELEAETAIVGTSSYGISVVTSGTSIILFQYDDLGAGTGLGVEPGQPDCEEKPVTWFKGRQYYGGFRYERIGGGSLTVVNMVKLGDYVKGVVPSEMGANWPIEALKAQAVAARSYALSLNNRHSGSHFDICPTTHCQAYGGVNNANSNSDSAVDLTANEVCTYNGEYASCYYYSSNGGASESSSVVWNSNQANYPYLIGVTDPYEAEVTTLNNSWTRAFSSATIISRMKNIGYNSVGSSIVSIEVASLTDTGNPKEITFTDNNGRRFTLPTRQVVGMLALPSYRYGFDTVSEEEEAETSVNINGTDTADDLSGLYAIGGDGDIVAVGGDAYVITENGVFQVGQSSGPSNGGSIGSLSSTAGNNGVFSFIGKGSGHNVGMSQWGAYAMAKLGYTYEEILKFYYTGITVETVG